MSRITFLAVLVILFFSSPVRADDPSVAKKGGCEKALFEGLPLEVSASFPDDVRAVRFKADEPELPVSDSHFEVVDAKGKEVTEKNAFDDELFALVPKDKPIAPYKDAKGRERWRFPTGMLLFHRIYFRTRPRQLFELRLQRLGEDGNMRFGVYRQAKGGPAGRLSLDVDCTPQKKEEVPLTLESGKATLKYTRIDIQSCNTCHNAGHSGMPGNGGPYEFLPGNQSIEAWRKEYRERHGFDPIRKP